MKREYKHELKYLYSFDNGMIAAFDQNGLQMRRFQGRDTEELRRKIQKRIDRQETIPEMKGRW